MAEIHLLTACSRPNVLPTMKENIQEVIRCATKHTITWHICFDTYKILLRDYQEASILQEPWIRLYECTTHWKKPGFGFSQLNFMLTHFRNGCFNGFIYILDDDNLLPLDFLECDYNEEESLIYLFKQSVYHKHQSHEFVYSLRGNDRPQLEFIDQAQMLWHSNINLFYDLQQASDGILIEQACKQYPYKCLDTPVVYYNRLNWDNYISGPELRVI